MKCQILFPRKKKSGKYFKNVVCRNFYPACKVLRNMAAAVSIAEKIRVQNTNSQQKLVNFPI